MEADDGEERKATMSVELVEEGGTLKASQLKSDLQALPLQGNAQQHAHAVLVSILSFLAFFELGALVGMLGR